MFDSSVISYFISAIRLASYISHSKAANSYPFSNWNYRFPEPFRAAIKGFSENFKLVVCLIEFYSSIKQDLDEYMMVVPHSVSKPECITFMSLRGYCESWSRHASPIRERCNSISGAIIMEEGLL